jgi:lupus La protein
MTTETASSNNNDKILKQVEFYFSDANLPRDRFLQEELKKSEEGWIALSVIGSFKRMQSLSTDMCVICDALKSSSLVEVSEDGLSVRRSVALPVEAADNMKTSVVVRGFPLESTLEDLEVFFGTVSDSVAAIRLRRNPQTKAFKGSVYLHLKNEEETGRLVELKTLSFAEGVSLEILSMTAFMEEQNAKQLARSKKSENGEEESSAVVAPLTLEDVKEMVLTVTGCPTDMDHRLLRTALSAKGPIAFVENVTSEGFSVVRFKEPVAVALIESITAEGGISMPGLAEPLQVREPTSEEVEAFFVKMQEFKAKAAANGGNFKPHRNYNNKNKRVRRA